MPIEKIHDNFVKSRRLNVLADHFAQLLPEKATVLDVGSGDGGLAVAIKKRKPNLEIRGIDTLIRDEVHVQVDLFDGQVIPAEDNSTDYVMFSDVLHHTDDPMVMLREATRVARHGVLIKDHLADGPLAKPTLRFMDEVGNRRFGVRLPYNYWSSEQWESAFSELKLNKEDYRTRIGLYPFWANWCFGRKLHFIARLGVAQS